MKNILLISIISIFIITACDNKEDKANAYGNFEATEIIVSAQGNGQILSFTPKEGAELKSNEVVGLIDTVVLNINKKLLQQKLVTIASQFDNLNSEIAVLKQQLKNAEINQKRVHGLFKAGASTKKQVDDVNGIIDLIKKQIKLANTGYKSINSQIDAVNIQIEQVNEALNKCRIINPVTGTVLVKYAEAGEIAGVGKPLYKIADLKEMKLKAYISGAQLPNIKIGQEVGVQFDKSKNENTSATGIVSWISPTAEFTPKTIQTKEERVNLVYAIKVTVKNSGTIKIGMPGEIYLR